MAYENGFASVYDVFTGEVNYEDRAEYILSLLKDSRALSESAPQGCFDTNLGGGNFIGPAKGRIDYIFVSPQIRVKDYAVLEDKRENGHYPSDHLPIVCNVEF